MKSSKSYAIFFIVIVSISTIPAYSSQLFVPSPYPTIQTAVDFAFDGDEIIVSPGTYTGETFVDKCLTIRSIDPNDPAVVDSTIIDGRFVTNCFYFFPYCNDCETICELSGFTIQNGNGDCGSICSDYEGVLNIKNCYFQYNFSSPAVCARSELNLTDCVFTWNASDSPPGAIVLSERPLTVSRCIFYHNYSTPIYITGEGLANIHNSMFVLNNSFVNASAIYGNANIYNCTIADNSGRPAVSGLPSSSVITNSIFYFNSPANFVSSPYMITYSDVQGGSFGWPNIGNFDADPLFVDPNNPDFDLRDYHLRPDSPCINAGNPSYGAGTDYIAQWSGLDIDGQFRISPGTCIDIGADEVQFPAIKLDSPTGSEVWTAGAEHKIKWQAFNMSQPLVKISFSSDAGANWTLIANRFAVTREYSWVLPDINSTQCLIKIEPAIPDSNTVYIGSCENFTIHPDSLGDDVDSVWPTENKDFRHTSNSDTSGPVLGCAKWQFMLDSPLAGTPVIGKNENIHLLCISGKLYTADANGSQLWVFDANSTILSSPAIGPDGSIYFGNEAGRLFAVSPEGSIRWNFDTFTSGISAPAISPDGKIYFGCGNGTLYCLDADGSEIWHYNIPPNGYWIAPVVAPPAI
ncbi:MAG: PQQ-binding-like beta-propeller repeat protein, partial [Phycisphaerae bacterium]|nr:PQQ-binding-like beta-propeller repeat protein [Phycisphaerae bacterium]